MENFIVSARKYRPQHFNTVVGQSHITNTLKNAIINKQLAQAYLFCGPRGVGKTTCARIFAKTINCTNVSTDGECCDSCTSCQSFNSGASLNIYEMDGASNNSVEDIRNLVDQVRYAPQLGDYKVYIIDEVHMLSTSAFNAFLKTLEEPPKHAKFILATTEKHKIIPTILSRCQVFNFNRIHVNDIASHLAFMAKSEHVNFEPEALRVIAQKADGGLRDACSMFDQMVAFTSNNLSYKQVVENLNVLDYDYYFSFTDYFLNQQLPKVLLLLDEILKKGFDAHHFLIGLGEHLRNLLVAQNPETIILMEVSESLQKKYLAQAKLCTATFILRALSLISKTDVNFKSAKNQRLLVEMALIQLSYLNAPIAETEKKNSSLETPKAEIKTENVQSNLKLSGVIEPEVKYINTPKNSLENLKVKSEFSLSDMKLNLKSEKEVISTNSEIKTNLPNNVVSENDIQNFIKNYIDQKQKSGAKQAAAIFQTAKSQLVHNTIYLTLQNETHKEQFTAIRQDFLDRLRADLKNNLLSLEIKIDEHINEVKAFKPADIFKSMAEKNPALLELKKKFDLEIDY